MTPKTRTGSVSSKSGKVRARRIITGIEIEGADSNDVVKAALEVMDHLWTGDVSGAQGVEAGEEIVTGFRYLRPQAPDREAFVAELQSLKETLAQWQKQVKAPAVVEAATRSIDEALAEAKKKEPLGKLIVKRLRDSVEFITEAGKALDAADKAGAVIAKVLPIAVALYQAAQKLF